MYLFGTGLTQHRHDAVTGRTTYDRVVDHDDPLAGHGLTQHVQLDLYARLTVALFGFDKGTAHVTVLTKATPYGIPDCRA